MKALEKKYTALDASKPLKSHSIPIDQDALKGHFIACQERAERLMRYESDELFKFLAGNNSLLPNLNRLRDNANEQAKQFFFQSIVPKVTLDKRGHIAKHSVDNEERIQHDVLFNYKLDVRFDKQIQIGTILIRGIQDGKFTSQSIRDFFRENSWLGATFNTEVGTHSITYCWLAQVMPSIDLYFQEIRRADLTPGYEPQLLLAVDSLVLKFEGIF